MTELARHREVQTSGNAAREPYRQNELVGSIEADERAEPPKIHTGSESADSEGTKEPAKEPAKLLFVFIFGFLASLVVVGGMVWLFAAYETAQWWPWWDAPRLSQDKLFEIVRNAVTTAAALGVGITLFFSYRRQQTAEQTQRIGAEAQLTASKAQRTAAAALELSNKQHTLDQDRRRDAVTSELRLRYAKTAEQLGSQEVAIRLAGIYSLAALADDWGAEGNADERQVCVDLLAAYYKLSSPGEAGATECRAAIVDVVLARLQKETSTRKFWGRCSIRLQGFGGIPNIEGLRLVEGGYLILQEPVFRKSSRLTHVQLQGGKLGLAAIKPNANGRLLIGDSHLTDGALACIAAAAERESGDFGVIEFSNVIFEGTHVKVDIPATELVFNDCIFKSGELNIKAGRGSVSFVNCRFEGDVFGAARSRSASGDDPIVAKTVNVDKDCTYAAGVPKLRQVTS